MKYLPNVGRESSWPWSYGNWIYNYLCNRCLSPLMLWIRFLLRARCTTSCDKVNYRVNSVYYMNCLPSTYATCKIGLITYRKYISWVRWLRVRVMLFNATFIFQSNWKPSVQVLSELLKFNPGRFTCTCIFILSITIILLIRLDIQCLRLGDCM
jgi:hypothetical protein